ncbi:2-C-methyl-D-erythritol 2,4-cyclodiphosphate synthase [Ruminococcaceae bacterium OttesenSCG-928-I18]|nr:2-C-methyl-D-erythritol 2,4-cyclodiphosphate synthase [Ruminococcaceae bacterium OttesenSCG-928-I18]
MIHGKKVTGVLVAAGRSMRMGFDKLFYKIGGREILLLSMEKLMANAYLDEVVLVAGENLPQVQALLKNHRFKKPYVIVPGGQTRTDSVKAGVEAAQGAALVAIHDAARPFVTDELISRVIEAGEKVGAAAPGLPIRDTVKEAQEGFVAKTVPREKLAAVQTPQVFDREAFTQALDEVPKEAYLQMTDDCMVMERVGRPVILVEGEASNRKITTQEDLRKDMEAKSLRVGHGYDVHRLVSGRKLVLGGVEIPDTKGLLGHSDADVLCHAVMDAILGAVALGDIGVHFPATDQSFKDANSLRLLELTVDKVRQEGYVVQNLDATLLCESPKLAPHIPAMRRNLARAIGLEMDCTSIKATTEEGLGFTGRREGIAAHCVVMLQGA